MDKEFLERMQTKPCEEILIQDKRVKTYGENYQSVKVKNRLRLLLLLSLVFGFLIIAGLVLLVLVLCGI